MSNISRNKRAFIKAVAAKFPGTDFAVGEDGEFIDEKAKLIWAGNCICKLAHSKYEPGLFLNGRVDDDGIVLSTTPQIYWTPYSAKKEKERLEKQHGVKFVTFTLARGCLFDLEKFYQENPKVKFDEKGKIKKLPLILQAPKTQG